MSGRSWGQVYVAGDGFLFEVGQAGDGEGAGVFGSCAFDAESENAGEHLGETFQSGRESGARGDRAELTEQGRCVAGPDGRRWEEGSERIAQWVGAEPHRGGIRDRSHEPSFSETERGRGGDAPIGCVEKARDVRKIDVANPLEGGDNGVRERGEYLLNARSRTQTRWRARAAAGESAGARE